MDNGSEILMRCNHRGSHKNIEGIQLTVEIEERDHDALRRVDAMYPWLDRLDLGQRR